jgi:hypothetical protein
MKKRKIVKNESYLSTIHQKWIDRELSNPDLARFTKMSWALHWRAIDMAWSLSQWIKDEVYSRSELRSELSKLKKDYLEYSNYRSLYPLVAYEAVVGSDKSPLVLKVRTYLKWQKKHPFLVRFTLWMTNRYNSLSPYHPAWNLLFLLTELLVYVVGVGLIIALVSTFYP